MHMLARSLAIGVAMCLFGTSANALTMQECSAKYNAAQAAGALKGQSWAQFRKTECATGATTAVTAPAAPSVAPTAAPKSAPVRPAAGNATFPPAVSPKYSSESGGKARLHTCLDQYNANKANSGNGGMNWIQKGGGYYSECNKRLKG
jgi:hypothetical protein